MITETAEDRRFPAPSSPDEPPAPEKKKRAPKADKEKPAATKDGRPLWPIAIRAIAITFALMLAIFVWHQVEQFFISDPRFILAPPPDEGEDSPNLIIEGQKHSNRQSIIKLFQEDFRRSVYQVPLAERRRDLLAVPWVKDASVSRIWPDRVRVLLVERKPVANVILSIGNEGAGNSTHVALVDDEGVILDKAANLRGQTLPTVRGIASAQTEADRKQRIGRVMKLLREAGPMADLFSEIDVTEPENLKVIQPAGDRAFTLELGREQYRRRLERFYELVDQIRRSHPNRTRFDLRHHDIVAQPEQGEPLPQ